MSWLRRNMKLRPMCPDHPKRIRCISCAERLIGEKSAADSASAASSSATRPMPSPRRTGDAPSVRSARRAAASNAATNAMKPHAATCPCNGVVPARATASRESVRMTMGAMPAATRVTPWRPSRKKSPVAAMAANAVTRRWRM